MKIAFFDIDRTLTSELDGSIPESTKLAIRKARSNGHLMFINTGRCFQNVEPRFREIGWDGYVCGCGTYITLDKSEMPILANPYKDWALIEEKAPHHGLDLLYNPQPADRIAKIREVASWADVDILFESRYFVAFDTTRPLHHPAAITQNEHFLKRNYPMNMDVYSEGFTCDKFVIWAENLEQIEAVRKVSDEWFECIDRGGTFREFVPKGFSKATGIQFLLDYYNLHLSDAYAFGDSTNDLAMLEYVPGSVAMGNSSPEWIKEKVSYVTGKASATGIEEALAHFGFI